VLPVYVPYSSSRRASANSRQFFAFWIGFMAQDITLSLYIGLAGSALAFLVVVPPWPFFNKNPESWLSPLTRSNMTIDVDGEKVG
jgi:signal peptidase complex subunit 1